MSAPDVLSTVLTSLGGASALGLAAAKVWTWWTTRDAETRAAAAKRATDAAAADQTATDRLIAAYEASAAAAEKRAADAAEGRLRVAEGLTSTGAAVRDLAAGVDRAADAIDEHDRREADSQARTDASFARVLALLEELVAHQRGTGEHRAASVPRSEP